MSGGSTDKCRFYRTEFILKYLMNKELQQDIREGCNRAEFWNKFQDAVFWGRGGVISSNNTYKQRVSALFLMLIMNAIVFYNKAVFGERIEKKLENIIFIGCVDTLKKWDKLQLVDTAS